MVDVSATSKSSSAFPIAPMLPYGGARADAAVRRLPRRPALSPDSGQIFAYPVTGGVPLSTTSLGDAFAHGDSGTLLDDHAYAFVAIGPSPMVQAGPWWHAFTWTTVRSDP